MSLAGQVACVCAGSYVPLHRIQQQSTLLEC